MKFLVLLLASLVALALTALPSAAQPKDRGSLPTSAQRSHTCNPRQECVAKVESKLKGPALDAQGRLGACTTTSGLAFKVPGRVGDSPLIGCGTYADEFGAVSCTGYGEAIIRTVLAKSAVDLLRSGVEAQAAAQRTVEILNDKTGATAGLILIDRNGNIGYARNTTHMPVCWLRDSAGPNLDS